MNDTAPSSRTAWSRDVAMNVVCRGLTLSCFAFLVAISGLAKRWIHPDCAMYLHIAEQMLDGAVPYVDFVEINPPLVMYLSMIPVALARAIGVPSVQVFNILIALVSGYGAWALLRHLPRIIPKVSEPLRHVVASVWLGFSFLVLIAGQWTLPTAVAGTDYGQREHWVVLGYVPFLLLRCIRWRLPKVGLSRAETLFNGALAGLVLCLKPQFLLAAALVEVYFFFESQRSARRRLASMLQPEVYAAVAIGLLYAAHFALIPTAMRQAFFGRWLPLASSRYAAYHWSWAHVFSLKWVHVSWALVVALWLPWRAPYRAHARRAAPFAIFGLGSTLVLIMQHKGWPYHVIPIAAGTCLTVVTIAVQAMQHQADTATEAGRGARIQALAISVRPAVFILLVGAWFASVVHHSPVLFMAYRSASLNVIHRATTPDDAVTYITTAVQTAYPEAYHSRRQAGSRFLWTFPVAYLFEGRTAKLKAPALYTAPPGREAEEQQLLEEMAADILERKPKLVFVWRGASSQGCPPGFVLSRYLEHSGFEERAFGDYFQSHRVGYWDVWARDGVNLQPRAPKKKKRPKKRR